MSTTPPPAPPEEDPFASYGNGENGESETLDQGKPDVAATPGRTMLVLGVLGVILVFLLYGIFSGGDDADVTPEKPESTVAPPIPAPPPPLGIIEEPTDNLRPEFIPPTPPPPVNIGQLSEPLRPEEDSAEKQRIQARMRSDMMISSSSGGSVGGLLGGQNDEAASDDPNSQFANQIGRSNTKAQKVYATRIGNLRRTIAQGRIIQATTESAINTELPAPVRAIVSRDVYGEAGTEPLIPKGSRLIGTYNTSLAGGQSRVYLIWTRVIRPDGVDVMINSPLVDQIGQAGIAGQVDTKFQQMFSRAIMASVVTIGLAYGSDEITGGGQTSTTNSAIGGTTQSGDGATTATVNALNRLGGTTDSFLSRYLNLMPSILVDQGTPVNVFVNRDVIFSGDTAGTQVVY